MTVKYFLFLFLFLTLNYLKAQTKTQIRFIDSIGFYNVDSIFPHKFVLKNCPKEILKPVTISLAYFPDLQCKAILFKSRKISTTLNARPTFASLLFSKKENRVYVIRINNQLRDSVISLSSVPFNAKIGLFSHEFSHFMDYQSKSLFGVLKRGTDYLSKAKKAEFEKHIDRLTIQRGLGWQLYDWSFFVLEQSNAKYDYKNFKRSTYLQPKEILELISGN